LVGGILLTVLLLAGCSSAKPKGTFNDIPDVGGASATAPAAPTGETNVASIASNASEQAVVDLIKVGDGLVITFSDMPILVAPFEDRVKADGKVTLLQNQTFDVAGKTRGELENEIRKRYVPDYFRTMTVSVQHRGDSQFYYVGGEVKRPDRQIYMARITVSKAIQTAGDFTDFAKKKAVELTRADGRKFVIDWFKAQKDPRLDLEVYPGDKIYVPRRSPFSL
jgi:polysaccharide export outer membrane protein